MAGWIDGHFSKCLDNVGVSSECRVLGFIGANMGAKSFDVRQNVLGAGGTAEIRLRRLLTRIIAKVSDPAFLKFSHDQFHDNCRASGQAERLETRARVHSAETGMTSLRIHGLAGK